ncbi:MAG: PHP domain-containing protein [Balneolaceae bacterium]|nr:MAG: PHP domain-containing protein [Balneolaceae bacterium]
MKKHPVNISGVKYMPVLVWVFFTMFTEGIFARQTDHGIVKLEISGTAGTEDRYTYRMEPFEVPGNIGQISVAFQYNSYRNEVEIGVFDPDRFRGTSRFSKSKFMIAETQATASYLPGPIPSGTWHVSLGFPVVNLPVSYRIIIELIPKTHPSYTGPETLALSDSLRWYSGDFHTHTGHSDGFGCRDTRSRRAPCQVYQIASAAHEQGLDFVAVADHNTISHHHDIEVLQPVYPDLLLLKSQEVTTFFGHANVHGTRLPVDFRLGFEEHTTSKLQGLVHDAGALFVIVHPGRPTGDSCTGCGWSADGTDYSRVDAIEIVNGTNVETGISGIPFWQERLNEGYRITAIGGSDDHGAGHGSDKPGIPTTMVFARGLSEASLLDGVRSGRVYLKTAGPQTPDADFYGIQQNQRLELGDSAVSGQSLTWVTSFLSTSDATLEILVNGEQVREVTIPANLVDPLQIQVQLPLSSGWIRANMRQNGEIIIITNPIYF